MRDGDDPARFVPLRRAASGRRALLFSLGPLLWVVAAVVVGIEVHRTDTVEVALVLTGGVCCLAVLVCLAMRRSRIRRERAAQ